MLIKVMQIDIDRGIPCSRSHCPIARALRRTFPGKTIHISGSHNFINGEFVDLPTQACQFMVDFDSLNSVQPFSFEFKISPDFPEIR